MVLRTRQQLIDWAKDNLPAPYNTIMQYGNTVVLGLFSPIVPSMHGATGWIIQLTSQYDSQYNLGIIYRRKGPTQVLFCLGLAQPVWANYIGHKYPDSPLNRGDYTPEQIKEFIHEKETNA